MSLFLDFWYILDASSVYGGESQYLRGPFDTTKYLVKPTCLLLFVKYDIFHVQAVASISQQQRVKPSHCKGMC